MDLAEWNNRLSIHFEEVRRSRRGGTELPVFALEHGLAPAEVLAVSDKLRAPIRVVPPVREHALAWTVYATEIGYGYAGDEYWQTFEAKTPGWTENGTRGWIRDAFVAFQKKFAGARPSGPWAEQFSIIAWPITHAILPRDPAATRPHPSRFGLRRAFDAAAPDFIAARSWKTSARFQNLVQAPALVGQIAAALLLQGKEGFRALLHPMTPAHRRRRRSRAPWPRLAARRASCGRGARKDSWADHRQGHNSDVPTSRRGPRGGRETGHRAAPRAPADRRFALGSLARNPGPLAPAPPLPARA